MSATVKLEKTNQFSAAIKTYKIQKE